MTELELLRETLADYCKVRKTLSDLPELSLVAVRRKREQVAADADLFEKVKKALAGPNGGWARFLSELGWTCRLPPCFETSGPPIMAEWLDDKGVAYRLTPAPSVAGHPRGGAVERVDRPISLPGLHPPGRGTDAIRHP